MQRALFRWVLPLAVAAACQTGDRTPTPRPTSSSKPATTSSGRAPGARKKVELVATAMGTKVVFAAYTSDRMGESETRRALEAAHRELLRLDELMSSWKEGSEVSAINRGAGTYVRTSPETFEVIGRSLWASRVSGGVFDITFNSMGDVWKFGDAQEASPRPPDPDLVERRRRLIDYRKISIRRDQRALRIPRGMKIGLGGIAKGYAVDRAAMVLRKAGVRSFLAQAGGDLYGAGRKPGGAPWVSGIQDPRGEQGEFFATIELTDHAFSTAGDYARSYLYDGKRYHHIIDPRTGYPATKSRSVTIWAPDAFTADAVDDAVFILGPEEGLQLVESMKGVGAVIVDADNRVHTSKRLEGKVTILRQPTGGT